MCKFLNKKKNILIILFIIILFVGTFIYLGMKNKTPPMKNIKIDGVMLPIAKAIEPFQLTDQDGKLFNQDNLKDKWTFMFFGFTNCGYVCPTTLAELNKMYKVLQKDLPEDKLPQIVLISVDPERDTVARMKQYVHAFNQHFIGLRGEEAATIALEKQLHISAVKMQAAGQPADHYMINHSAEILVFNPDAKLQAYFSYPHQSEQMIADYKLILNATE